MFSGKIVFTPRTLNLAVPRDIVGNHIDIYMHAERLSAYGDSAQVNQLGLDCSRIVLVCRLFIALQGTANNYKQVNSQNTPGRSPCWRPIKTGFKIFCGCSRNRPDGQVPNLAQLSDHFYGDLDIMMNDHIPSVYFPQINHIVTCQQGGSPTNHPGSMQRQDTGQGSFGPLTGGLNLTPTGEPPTCGAVQSGLHIYAKCLDRANLAITTQKFKKEERTVP